MDKSVIPSVVDDERLVVPTQARQIGPAVLCALGMIALTLTVVVMDIGDGLLQQRLVIIAQCCTIAIMLVAFFQRG